MASKKAAKKTTPTVPIKSPARGSAEKGKGPAPTKAKAVGKAQPAPKGKKVAASEQPSAGKPKSSAVGKAKSVVKPLPAPKTPAKALPKTKAKPAVMAKGTPEATSKAPVKLAPPANASRAKNRTKPEAPTQASKTKREPARELSIAKAHKPVRGAKGKPQAEPALKLVSKAKPEPANKAKPEPTKAKPKAPAKEEHSPPVATEAKPSRAKKAQKSKPEPEPEGERDASESSSVASASPGGLTIGDSAPSFVLQDESSTVVSSETLRGSPYVLYFYPKDDTPGCTLQACGFRDLQPRFSAKGVRILGVSPDSPDTHARFKKKYGLTFPLLSDPEKTLAKAYGVWVKKTNYGREYMGVERSTFYVDKNGTIEQVWRGVRVPGHVDAVLDAV
ncbi:MAG TPA: thioredoxin-dependent thiol peroxidase [Polyangiaceae bacterium]